MKGKELIGREHKCPICGKVFIKKEGWVFKRTIAKHEKDFCSWGCMRKFEVEKGTKIDRRERIIQAIKDGLSNREISSLLDEDQTKINYWRKRIKC